MLAIPEREPAAARWATRAALFSFGLIAAAAFLHRLFSMPTPVAFNLFVVAMGIALFSIACAGLASWVIWQTGRPGTPRVLFAVCLSLALLMTPLLFAMWVRQYPLLADITTDFETPPVFTIAPRQRGPGSNPVSYDRRTANEQQRAYPDIKPMLVPRSSEEVYALVVDAVKRLKMQIEREDPPDAAGGSPGIVECVDRTLIMGFYEDVAVRVSGNDEQARVDIRSASRFGSGDMGHNAERIRELIKEIQIRLDATVPGQDDRALSDKKAKPGKGDDPRQGSRRKSRGREQ